MLLVHCAPTTLEPYRSKHLGVLNSPRRWYTENELGTWPWAADNDAYSNWDEGRYRQMLEGIADLPGGLFVTSPDVVGDAKATRDLFEEWYADLLSVMKPIGFVAQDGLVCAKVPWKQIGAVFIGGSDRFKMGEDARLITREAKERGLWVHMGRVNTQQRLRYAKAIRCDSIDGTSLSWFRDTYLPSTLVHAAQPPQMILETS